MILDGVEPLQYPPGPMEGRLKDPGLAALLKNLAADNPGLSLVTTREHIADLDGFRTAAPQISLEELDPDSAVELLRRLKVDGREKELRAAVEEFGRHALTLTLLGNYLHKAHKGDIRKRKEIDLRRADEKLHGRAFQVIAAYTRWLGEGPELSILRLLGLFDRPAEAGPLAALRAKPAIPGLTESLVNLSEDDWQFAVSTLRDHSLLAAADPREPETLDAHPLVRAYFAEEIEKENREGWEEGNGRLYEYLRTSTPDFPDTIEAMQPLYAAIVHGCRAGRQQEALEEVFWRRIRRKEEAHSWKKLGAFSSELTALAGFFDRLWSQTSIRITEKWKAAWVLNEAAFVLGALGRPTEALEPMQAALEACIAQKSWKDAAASASNLSALTLTLGNVTRSFTIAEQSVELAERSGDAPQRRISRTAWADALHQAGRWEESEKVFRDAEAIQMEMQPQYPRLYSLGGFRYCDLLLGRAEPENGAGLEINAVLNQNSEKADQFRQACREVMERSGYAEKIAQLHRSLLNIALHQLSLSRSHLGLAVTSVVDRNVELARAATLLDWSVDGLRKAGQEDYLPRGLLARAALRRFGSDFTGAAEDLTEALEIAERSSMRLHECDAHLESTRLCRDQGDLTEARRHLAQARKLVEETGYERRRREVEWLERELADAVEKKPDTLYEAPMPTTSTPRFRIALSFPGEHRPLVQHVAEQLAAAVGRDRVLYDKYYEAEFARMDLDVYLPRLYREQSELIVLFLCPDYAAKRWCQLEWRHIRQLIATVDAGRIMLLSLGSPGDLSGIGILPGDGYVDIAGRSAAEIAGLILQRLNGGPAAAAIPVTAPEPGVSRNELLRRLKELPAAQFEELVFQYDSDNSVPGRTEAQAVRAIELLKVLRARDGGFAGLTAELRRLRGGGHG